jgi:hypothetical protein
LEGLGCIAIDLQNVFPVGELYGAFASISGGMIVDIISWYITRRAEQVIVCIGGI